MDTLNDKMATLDDKKETLDESLVTFDDNLVTFDDKKETLDLFDYSGVEIVDTSMIVNGLTSSEAMVSNAFTKARWKIGVNELKLLFLAVANMDPVTLSCTITADDFSDMYDIDKHETYRTFKRSASKLMKQVIEFENEKGWEAYNLTSKSSSQRYSGTFDIKLNPDLRPLFVNLTSRFLKVNLRTFKKLNTAISIRLYLLLKTIYSYKEADIPNDFFQRALGVSYSKRGDFLRQLRRANENLKKTDVSLEVFPTRGDFIKIKINRTGYIDTLSSTYKLTEKDARQVLDFSMAHHDDYEAYLDSVFSYVDEKLKAGEIKKSVQGFLKEIVFSNRIIASIKDVKMETKKAESSKKVDAKVAEEKKLESERQKGHLRIDKMRSQLLKETPDKLSKACQEIIDAQPFSVMVDYYENFDPSKSESFIVEVVWKHLYE